MVHPVAWRSPWAPSPYDQETASTSFMNFSCSAFANDRDTWSMTSWKLSPRCRANALRVPTLSRPSKSMHSTPDSEISWMISPSSLTSLKLDTVPLRHIARATQNLKIRVAVGSPKRLGEDVIKCGLFKAETLLTFLTDLLSSHVIQAPPPTVVRCGHDSSRKGRPHEGAPHSATWRSSQRTCADGNP